MKTSRTAAVDIPREVKQRVWERDGGRCIICGSTICKPNAHFIPRSAGGLGIEENIVTLCTEFSDNKCHYRFDFGTADERAHIGAQIKKYLQSKYDDWDIEKLYFRGRKK